MWRTKENRLHTLFVLSVLLKAFNGVLEMLLGAALLFTASITSFIENLAYAELIEDPTDFFAGYIGHFLSSSLVHTQTFAAVYLLSHGVIKIFLVAALLRRKLWAYPAAITVFFLFIVYQLYRFSSTHSALLIVITVFDLIVIVLTWYEYQALKTRAGINRREALR